MSVFLSPIGNEQQESDTGAPLSGGMIYTYLAGTSTPATTWTTNSGLVAHANPIILNTLGLPNSASSAIWLTSGIAYKFQIFNSLGVLQRTVDNISGIGNNPASASEWVLFNAPPTYINANSFSVVGDQTNIFQVLRRVQGQNTGGTSYGTVLSSAFLAGITTVTLINTSGVLDSGLSAVSYGLLSAINPSVPATYAKSGANSDITSLLAITAINGLASINGSSISGFRNRIINGGFPVNQRGYVSGTATASGSYMHDRFKSTTANSAYTFTQAPVDTTITITAGTIAQVVEDKNVEGGVYTLSWTGTATARIAINGAATSGAYAASPITTASATAGQAITVEFSAGTLGKVQLESGSVASNFERRPYSVELSMCQRYFHKTFPMTVVPAQNAGVTGAMQGTMFFSGSAFCFHDNFPVRMRVAPTIVTFNPSAANAQIRNITANADYSATAGTGTETFVDIAANTNGSLGSAAAVHYTASAEL